MWKSPILVRAAQRVSRHGRNSKRSGYYYRWRYNDSILSIDVGGAAGCVVAGRLAKRFPTLQILIIEAGRNNFDDPLVRTPAFCIHHLKPDSQTAHFHVSKPSPHVAGRSNTVASGGVLGGGSSINFMMYTRASASDYDDWNTEGWTFEELKPLLLQVFLASQF